MKKPELQLSKKESGLKRRLVKLKGSDMKPRRRHDWRENKHGPLKWLDKQPSWSKGLKNRRKSG